MSLFVVVGIRPSKHRVRAHEFFTGKSGDAFLSPAIDEAFGFETREGAVRKASLFRAQVTPLTGIWFGIAEVDCGVLGFVETL